MAKINIILGFLGFFSRMVDPRDLGMVPIDQKLNFASNYVFLSGKVDFVCRSPVNDKNMHIFRVHICPSPDLVSKKISKNQIFDPLCTFFFKISTDSDLASEDGPSCAISSKSVKK